MVRKKLKVTYVVSNLRRTGPIVQLKNLIRYLDRSIFEPVIVTLSPEDEGLSMIDEFQNMDVQIVSFNCPKGTFPSKGCVKDVFWKIKPDILHTHGFRPDVLSLSVVSVDRKIKRITTVHCNPFEDYPRLYGIKGLVAAAYHINVLRKIPVKVACSCSLSKILRKFGLKTMVILNSAELGVDIEMLRLEREKIREKLGFHTNDFVFVYIGELIKRKNIAFLIKVFNKISGSIHLMIVGDGEERKKLQYKAPKNIIFLGRQQNAAPFLVAADAFISASLSEGLPTAVLEALSVGLPVFLSDIPAHHEILELASESNIKIGRLFNLKSLPETISKLQNFIREKYRADDIIMFFKRNFSAEIFSKRYQDLYIRLVEKDASL